MPLDGTSEMISQLHLPKVIEGMSFDGNKAVEITGNDLDGEIFQFHPGDVGDCYVFGHYFVRRPPGGWRMRHSRRGKGEFSSTSLIISSGVKEISTGDNVFSNSILSILIIVLRGICLSTYTTILALPESHSSRRASKSSASSGCPFSSSRWARRIILEMGDATIPPLPTSRSFSMSISPVSS